MNMNMNMRMNMRMKWLSLFLLFFRIGFAEGASKDGLVISEFLASNNSVNSDVDGDYSDWIELWNNSDATIDLNNWSLTDDETQLEKWQFPSQSIAAGEYLLIFSSGKNKGLPQHELHTNFKLSTGGEYLGLVDPDGIVKCSFNPFPEQTENISYGLLDGAYVYLSEPTPSLTNSPKTHLAAPIANFNRGFYTERIQVELTSGNEEVEIYFTLDASAPSDLGGTLYEESISISRSTILRAVAVRDGETSNAMTCTYLFVEDIMNQSNVQNGYPTTWGPYTAISGSSIADYEMDPDIVKDPLYENQMPDALKSLPSVSLVSEISNFFSLEEDPETGGIYIFTGAPISLSSQNVFSYGPGKSWERPVSMEFFASDGSESIQVDAGVSLQGGHSRRPEKSPKHSFRIAFREEYGSSELKHPFFDEKAEDKFDKLVFRAAFGNTWRHATAWQRNNAQHIRDVWAKDTQLEMGYAAGHCRFVNLYINGIYWGVYNISERLDDEFMGSYFQGGSDDFDVIKDFSEAVNGNLVAWDYLWEEVSGDIESLENYQRLLGKNPDGTDNAAYPDYLELNNLIDYILINFYGGNTDWDHHNWVAGRNRNQMDDGFRFFCWDTERIMESATTDIINKYNVRTPSGIFQNLLKNDEFKVRLMDQIQKHFFNGGALTPQACIDRYQNRADEVQLAMIAESARWGDYRRDVHPWSDGPFDLYTQKDWVEEKDQIINSYFPYRTETVLNQLRSAGMFPRLTAATFNEYEGDFLEGFELTMTADEGVIYYTVDGTDPREIGGNISLSAKMYDDPIHIGANEIKIEARVYKDDKWSPKTEAKFNKEEDDLFVLNSSLQPSMDVSIYPNPFSTSVIFSFTLSERSDVVIKICSLDGRVVEQRKIENLNAGMHSREWSDITYPEGVYIYYLKSSNFIYSGKIIKSK